MKKYFLFLTVIVFAASCVPAKSLKQAQLQTASLRADSVQLAGQIAKLQADIAGLNGRISSLSNKNSQLGEETANQQSKLTESQLLVQKQQQRLQRLQDLLAQQKNKADLLKIKMSDALKGFNSNDLSVFQKNGKVYVSLSENLLFPSGSAVINPKGIDALAKLAIVLNFDTDVAVNIEGHTDSIPMRGKYNDNWALSTERANSIVRILVNSYKVDPVRVIASGHSFYDPLDTNSTADGRARNRRTEIILSPKLDEMYKLLEN